VTKTYTDRQLLQSCLNAMEVCQQRGEDRTDWRHMIDALRKHLSDEPGATHCPVCLLPVTEHDHRCALKSGAVTCVFREGCRYQPKCADLCQGPL